MNSITNTSDSSTVNSYDYDGVGNRTDFYSVNALNQYYITGFAYNSRGDMTDDGVHNFTYDAKDRVISIAPDYVTDGSIKTVSISYDGQNRMISKEVDIFNEFGGGGWSFSAEESRQYIYQGNRLAAELDFNNHLVTSYTWGPNGLVAITDWSGSSPKTYTPLYDGNGNVVSLIDNSNGHVAATYVYDAWGNVTASGPAANVCSIQFGGMIAVSQEGEYMSGTRLYDPFLGRWTTPDTIDYAGGYNLYVYCGNDPINKSDRMARHQMEHPRVAISKLAMPS